MRRIRALLPHLVFPAALASQQPATSRAADLITLARDQIRANHADSALTLLKLAADSTTGGSVGDREQAYVLLGVLEYIAHRDSSGTALAFRHALQIDPGFQASGLAEVDSALVRILAVERNAFRPDTVSTAPAAVAVAVTAAASAPPGAPTANPANGVLHDCVRRCRGGEIKPEVIDRPQFTRLDQAMLGRSQTHGFIVVQFVVGVEGAPEPESIRVMTNTAQGLTNQVLDAVRALHFRPATLAGAPVRAAVEMRFEFRASGTNYMDYTITGP